MITSATFRERAEALWFIGHFVGDVHQPMHVGYPEDRGGNDHKLKFSKTEPQRICIVFGMDKLLSTWTLCLASNIY